MENTSSKQAPGSETPVSTGAATRTCSNPSCDRTEPAVFLCNNCKTVNYCSKQCQIMHWGKKGDVDRHKPACKALRAAAAQAQAPPAPPGGEEDGAAKSTSDGPQIHVGMGVYLHGLKSGRAMELNSKYGIVKEIPKEKAGPCLVKVGSELLSIKQRSLTFLGPKEAVPSTTTYTDTAGNGPECFVCLDADIDVIPLGCGCRDAAGGAHLACMVDAISAQEKPRWSHCKICSMEFRGSMQIGLAEAYMKQTEHLPEKHVESCKAKHSLAFALLYQNRFSEAEPVFRAAIKACTTKLGHLNAFTLDIVHGLANTIAQLGKVGEAIKLHQRNLKRRRKVLGAKDMNTFASEVELATVLHKDGQYDVAETMFRTTITAMKKCLAKNNHHTLITIGKFMDVLVAQEKYKEVVELGEEMKPVYKRIYGPEHANTINLHSTLTRAIAFSGDQGRLACSLLSGTYGDEKFMQAPHLAVDIYTKLVAEGCGMSMYNLGILYKDGHGVEQDETKAFALMKESVCAEWDSGNPMRVVAQNMLGKMYLAGLGTKKDAKLAEQMLLMAAKGDERAGCSNEIAEAQYILGFRMYKDGHYAGVPKDWQKAVHWLTKCADRGDSEAQLHLGNLFDVDLGRDLDESMFDEKRCITAMKWFKQSADQGNRVAQRLLYSKRFVLAIIYESGIYGAQQNIAKAAWLYAQCSKTFDSVDPKMMGGFSRGETQYRLGILYEIGGGELGFKQDLVKAVQLFRESGDLGYAEAKYRLGEITFYGKLGIEQDVLKALDLYQESAKLGNVDAKTRIKQAMATLVESTEACAEKGDARSIKLKKWLDKLTPTQLDGEAPFVLG